MNSPSQVTTALTMTRWKRLKGARDFSNAPHTKERICRINQRLNRLRNIISPYLHADSEGGMVLLAQAPAEAHDALQEMEAILAQFQPLPAVAPNAVASIDAEDEYAGQVFNEARAQLGMSPLSTGELAEALSKPVCVHCAGTGRGDDLHEECPDCDGTGKPSGVE